MLIRVFGVKYFPALERLPVPETSEVSKERFQQTEAVVAQLQFPGKLPTQAAAKTAIAGQPGCSQADLEHAWILQGTSSKPTPHPPAGEAWGRFGDVASGH